MPNGGRAIEAASWDEVRAPDDVPASGAAVSYRTVEQQLFPSDVGESIIFSSLCVSTLLIQIALLWLAGTMHMAYMQIVYVYA